MAGYSRLTLFAPCSPLGGAGMALLAGLGGHASPAVTAALPTNPLNPASSPLAHHDGRQAAHGGVNVL